MKIVLTPDWFLGSDVLIAIFSFVVLFLLFILCIRNYKLTRKRSFKYLGVGFFLIAFAELATALTKLVLYYDIPFTQNVGQAIVTYNLISSVDIFYYIGFFFHKLLTLAGFYVIYRLIKKERLSSDFLLMAYFIIVASIFSSSFYYVFHISALILLLMIIKNYWKIYQKNKSSNTKILIISFGLLALSQLIFILSKLEWFYAIAQIMQLASYISLLILVMRILKHGKKEKQNQYSI